MENSKTPSKAPTLRCKHRLPSPEIAGYGDRFDVETGEVLATGWETLKEAMLASPHLRPCARHKGSLGTWNWIYRTTCETCPDAVRHEHN